MGNIDYMRAADLHMAYQHGEEAAKGDAKSEPEFKENFAGDAEAEREFQRGWADEQERQLSLSKTIQ